MTPQEVVKFLSLLTLASNIGVIAFLLLFIIQKLGIAKKSWSKVLGFFTKKVLLFSFIVALVATSGSLYFSEVAGFAPCILCWYQRILMYPQTVILGVALWRKSKDVWQYSLPLSLIGLSLAAYHYHLQISPNALAPCATVGFSVSCSERFFTHYGYITIPWMSLSAFLLITIGMLLIRSKSR